MNRKPIAPILIFVLLAIAVGALLVLQASLPTLSQVQRDFASSDLVVLDRRENVISSVRQDFRERRSAWVKLSQVPDLTQKMLISAEDRRFWHHTGVDPLALLSSIRDGLTGLRFRGASTLTMQLVRQIQPQTTGGVARRKVEEILHALVLESIWSKQEILEAYLNVVPFKGELRGVGAASLAIFGKAPSALSPREQALLIAMLPSPNAQYPVLVSRAKTILHRVEPSELPDADWPILERVSGRVMMPGTAEFAHSVARRVPSMEAKSGFVRSTIDSSIQRESQAILDRNIAALRERGVHDGAAVVIEVESGDVLAYVANVDSPGRDIFVDGVRAKRQAGSTLKPLLYALAIDRRILTAATRLDDSEVEIALPAGVYKPKNYDHSFRGPVTVREALASSLNVPAVRTVSLLGADEFQRFLKRSGFSVDRPGHIYGDSIALGSLSVRLLELTDAFRMLAARGEYSRARMVIGEKREGRRVLSEAAAYIVSDILADREARSGTFGLENALATPYWSAVKTGTSRNMTDNWCVGFTSRFAVGVWVGNFDGTPMKNVSGVSGAAPAWLEMQNFLRDRFGIPATPIAPQAIRSARISSSGATELFLAGTEPESEDMQKVSALRIIKPVTGTYLAIDPDIPSAASKVEIRVSSELAGARLSVDGETIATDGTTALWSPIRGEHFIAIHKEHSLTPLDSVQITVR